MHKRYIIRLAFLLISACTIENNLTINILPSGKPSPPTSAKKIITASDEESLYALLEQNGPPFDILSLEQKTYRLNAPLRLENLKHVTIEGNDAVLILDSRLENVIELKNSHNITIRNIHASHTEPEGPVGCLGNVIAIFGGDNIVIENSELNGSGIVGIAAYDSTNLLIRQNHIHSNSEYAIIYQGPSVTIINNLFEDNGHNNQIAYSPDSHHWPPKYHFNTNRIEGGLILQENQFK